MSKGEDVQAYTRILKFQNKRYGLTVKDLVIFTIGFVLMVTGTFLIVSSTNSTISSFVFIIAGFFALLFVIAFIDFSLGFGLFTNNQIVYSSIIILVSVLITVITSIFAGEIFTRGNPNAMSFLVLIHYLLQSLFISYFIITSTPTREGREEMIGKLEEIKNEIEQLPVTELGSKNAANRALKWLEFQQRDDGIWGDENPLYETSEVLRSLIHTEKGLNHSWKQIIDGQEEIRTVEQTYFLVMEALDTAVIEPSYEMLIPVLAVGEIDPNFAEIDSEVFLDFISDLDTISEWEFVQSLENYIESKSNISEIPIIFPLSRLFYLKSRLDIAQKCADIFSQTFDILIRRAATRYKIPGEKELSNFLLGKMYNALIILLRGYKKLESTSLFSEFGLEGEPTETDQDLDLDIPGISLPSFEEELELPSMSDSDPLDGFDITQVEDDSNQSMIADMPEKIKIDVSMAAIRNYIRSRQSIDGSWNGRIDTTAECLTAVLDQESAESNFIKLALHYLLALQEKNGSWQNDIVITSKVLGTLLKINKAIGLGVF